MAATPPMKTNVPTPPSPLHGGRYDTYHPSRISTRQIATRESRAIETPPPPSDELPHKQSSSLQRDSASNHMQEHFNSPPSSTHTSPRKKARNNSYARGGGSMNGEDSSSPPSEDLYYNPAHNLVLQPPSLNPSVNMLPTPAKTPRKKPTGQAALNAGGRVLFPDRPEDPMPIPRKNRKAKRQVGFSLYSSMEDEDAGVENDISIFTDSKDKVPELDPSEDNPFLDQAIETAPQPEPSKGKTSRKRKAAYGLDGSKEIEEAFNREEGMVYVFRGKKVYRKFPAEDTRTDDEDTVAVGAAEPSKLRPHSLTRSSVKPRLLFPTAAQKAKRLKSSLEDEEAPTDIDEPHATETDKVILPEKRTPVRATFQGLAPDTPPDTGHATRSATKKATKDSSSSPAFSPVKLDFNRAPKGKKASPFDGWARTKPGAAPVARKGKKRGADAVDNDPSEDSMVTKRMKTDAV